MLLVWWCSVIRPLLLFLRHLCPSGPVVLTTLRLPGCAPWSAQLSSDRPVISWHSTCLKPSSSCTASQPPPQNAHLYALETKAGSQPLSSLCLAPGFCSSSSGTTCRLPPPSCSAPAPHTIIFPLHLVSSLPMHPVATHSDWVGVPVPSCVGFPVSPSLVSLFSRGSLSGPQVTM